MPSLLTLSVIANLCMIAFIGFFLARYHATARPEDGTAGYSCLYEFVSEIEMRDAGMFASIWNVSCEANSTQSPFTSEAQDIYLYDKKQYIKSQNNLPLGQLIARSGKPIG